MIRKALLFLAAIAVVGCSNPNTPPPSLQNTAPSGSPSGPVAATPSINGTFTIDSLAGHYAETMKDPKTEANELVINASGTWSRHYMMDLKVADTKGSAKIEGDQLILTEDSASSQAPPEKVTIDPDGKTLHGNGYNLYKQ